MVIEGIMGKFYTISDWIMKLVLINIIWLLFNLPILYMVVNMLFIKTSTELYSLGFSILIMIPIFLFPATTAMYAVIRKWIIASDDSQIFSKYWRYYKENFIRSLSGGIILTAIWTAWGMNYKVSAIEIGSLAFYFYVVITVFLLSITSHFLSDTVHFELKLFTSLKKALLMSISNAHYTISLAGASFAIIYILYQIHPVLSFFLAGSIVAFIYFYGYYQIYLKARRIEMKETTLR